MTENQDQNVERLVIDETIKELTNAEFAHMVLESVTQVFPDEFDDFDEDRHADGLMMLCFAFTEMAPHPQGWDREAILRRLRDETDVTEDALEMVNGLNGAFKEMGLPDEAGVLALFYQHFVEAYYEARMDEQDVEPVITTFAYMLGGE